jgi:2,4-dienoyl-CoA reductase-like NADH-dependent reductase (Old Yellow Enzyme family)
VSVDAYAFYIRWLALGADLVSFGRAFLPNPDLVERLRAGLPLNDADPAAFHWNGRGRRKGPSHSV